MQHTERQGDSVELHTVPAPSQDHPTYPNEYTWIEYVGYIPTYRYHHMNYADLADLAVKHQKCLRRLHVIFALIGQYNDTVQNYLRLTSAQ